jgi:hypothetical protein
MKMRYTGNIGNVKATTDGNSFYKKTAKAFTNAAIPERQIFRAFYLSALLFLNDSL